jgi:cytochrome c553
LLGAGAALMAFAVPAVSLAQDALRGKRLYLDAARVVGSGVSCVDCHGGLPGGLFGIGRAANDAAAVERAVNAVPQMTPLRGRLGAQDYADLAAYIGNPAVPSPTLRNVISGPAATSSAERFDFGVVSRNEQSAASRWHIVNEGSVGLTVTGAPQLRGNHPQDFVIVASDCFAGQTLAAGASCSVDLAFRPLEGVVARQAAVAVAHDWVGGETAVALAGAAAAAPVSPAPSVSAGGGGGATALGLLCALMAAAVARSRCLTWPAAWYRSFGRRTERQTQAARPSRWWRLGISDRRTRRSQGEGLTSFNVSIIMQIWKQQALFAPWARWHRRPVSAPFGCWSSRGRAAWQRARLPSRWRSRRQP